MDPPDPDPQQCLALLICVSLSHYKLGIGTLLSRFCPSLVSQTEVKTTMFIFLYDSISQFFAITREIFLF
jgi:hypothetical protein